MIYTGIERLNQGVQLVEQTELVKNIERSVTSAGNWLEKKQIVYLAEVYQRVDEELMDSTDKFFP